MAMKLIPGKRYRVTDQTGSCLICRAITEERLEPAPSYLAGFTGMNTEPFVVHVMERDVTIEPLESPKPAPTTEQLHQDLRQVILLEILQAIQWGIKFPENPKGQKAFDPEQCIEYLRTRLEATGLKKGPAHE